MGLREEFERAGLSFKGPSSHPIDRGHEGASSCSPWTLPWLRWHAAGAWRAINAPGGATERQERGSWWPHALLAVAVLAVSSAGAVFATMPEVGAVTLAAWRLEATAVLLGAGFAVQWRSLSSDDRFRVRQSALALAGAGVCLGLHFWAWVWGVRHTSLTHSLLFVCASPFLIAILLIITRKPISSGELIGTAMGAVGAVLLAMGAGSREGVTVAGDLMSLLGSALFVGYLNAGSRLRQWMPLMVYAFPVTLVGALLLCIASLALDRQHGPLSWLWTARYFPKVLYLALGPGLAGHTLINACVSRLQPLEITLALTLEPIVGSLLGLAMEVQRAPSAWTWAGGTVLLASTVLVSVSSSRRKSAGDGVRGAVGYEAVGGGVKDWAASRSARRGTDFVPGLSKGAKGGAKGGQAANGGHVDEETSSWLAEIGGNVEMGKGRGERGLGGT